MFYDEIVTMKAFVLIFISVLFLSCQSDTKTTETVADDTVSPSVFKADIEALDYVEYELDAKAATTLSAWDKYSELSVTIAQLKSGDVSYFNNEMKVIEAFFNEFKTSMPEAVKTPSILARALALETKMLKLQSALHLDHASEKEQLNAVKETLVAFSNFNLQINKKFEKEAQNIVKP